MRKRRGGNYDRIPLPFFLRLDGKRRHEESRRVQLRAGRQSILGGRGRGGEALLLSLAKAKRFLDSNELLMLPIRVYTYTEA